MGRGIRELALRSAGVAVTRDAPAARTAPAPGPPAPPTRLRLRAWATPPRVVVVATVTAAALVLVRLGSRGLWFDEGFSVGLVREPWDRFVQRVTDWEVNQSAYYVVFRAWYRLGDDVALMRLLSAGFFVATVPLVYLLGRRLFDARVGALGAVLVAIHPLAVEWGQQLRAYSMVLFLVTAATLLFVRAVERPTTARSLAYAAVAALAVYAHFFAALVIAAHAVSLLLVRPLPRRLLAVAPVTLAVLGAPAARYVLGRDGDPLQWVETPGPRGLVDRLGGLAGGGPLQLVVLGSAACLGLAMLWPVVRRAPRSDAAWRAGLASAWLVLPPAFVLLSTYTFKPLLVAHYLIVIVPAVGLVVAAGIVRLADRLADRRVAAVVAAVVVVASLHGVLRWHTGGSREEWREATEAVVAEASPGDSLVVVPTPARESVTYYLRHLDGPPLELLRPDPGDPPGSDDLWEIRRNSTAERLQDWDPLGTYAGWRDRHYRLAEERRFERVLLRRYERVDRA